MKTIAFSVILTIIFPAFIFGQAREFLYCGTFSVRGSKGVYIFSFDRKQGTLELKGTVHSLNDPTYLEISPDKRFLYTVNRQAVDTSKYQGSVTSYAIDTNTGLPVETGRISSYGNSPCHINISRDGKTLFVSHYRDGSLTMLSANEGRITGLVDSVIHRGSSIHPNQKTSHVHSTWFLPDSDFIITADLGSDKLWVYKWDKDKIFRPASIIIDAVPGSGPRHMDFGGKKIYVAEELSSTVSVYDIDLKTPSAKRIQRISTIPDTFHESNSVADIHLSPDHKFLYVSNRGHNSLAIFRVDEKSGKITFVAHQSCLGKTPRNFYMDRLGEFVIVANQDSDDIFLFRRDKESGLLTSTGQKLNVPSPVCLKMSQPNGGPNPQPNGGARNEEHYSHEQRQKSYVIFHK